MPFPDLRGDSGKSPWATLCACSLVNAVFWNRLDGARQLLDLMEGRGNYEILSWQVRDQDIRPSMCLVRTSGDNYLWAATGTVNQAQWVGNFLGSRGVRYGNSGVYANSFFKDLASAAYDEIRPLLPDTITGKVRLLGHSLSSAVANILANYLMAQGYNVQVLGLAEPRGVTLGYDLPHPDDADHLRVYINREAIALVPPEEGQAYLWAAFGAIFANSPLFWGHYGRRLDLDQDGVTMEYASDPDHEWLSPRSLVNAVLYHPNRQYQACMSSRYLRLVDNAVGRQVALLGLNLTQGAASTDNLNFTVSNTAPATLRLSQQTGGRTVLLRKFHGNLGQGQGLDAVAAIQQAVILTLLDYNRIDLLTKYLAALGISGEGSLTVIPSWRGTGSSYANGVPPAVLIHQADFSVLAVAGLSDPQLFSEALRNAAYRGRWRFDGHYVHAGLRDMADALYDRVRLIEGVVSRPLMCISGHSLGGAVANGVGFRFQEAERLLEATARLAANRQQLMTFGAPRFFTSTLFNDDVGFEFPASLERVVISRDAVPNLPVPRGVSPVVYATRASDRETVYANQNVPFQHIGEAYFFNDAGRLDAISTQRDRDLQPANAPTRYLPGVHAMSYYFQVVRLWAQARDQISARDEYGCQLVRYATGIRDDEPEQPDPPTAPEPPAEVVLPRRSPPPPPLEPVPQYLVQGLMRDEPSGLAQPLLMMDPVTVDPPGIDVNSLLNVVPGAAQVAQDLFDGAASVSQQVLNAVDGISIVIRSARRSVLPSTNPGPSPPSSGHGPRRAPPSR